MLSPETTAKPVITPAAARFRLLSSTVQPITPAFLAEFRNTESGTLERVLNEGRVKYLFEKYLSGQLMTFQWIVATLRKEGKKVRANGQHSSEMLSRLDPFPEGLQAHIEHYEVEDGDMFAELFQQIDNRRSARGSIDVSTVYQGLHELGDIDRHAAKLAVDGYTWYMKVIERAAMPLGDMQYTAFGDQHMHPYIRWVASVFDSKTPEMRRKEVVGAMFATFNVNETAARDFWQDVSLRGDLEQPDLPQTCLDQWLLDQKEGTIERVNGKELYGGCIHAWNASRDDKRISKIRSDIRKITPRD